MRQFLDSSPWTFEPAHPAAESSLVRAARRGQSQGWISGAIAVPVSGFLWAYYGWPAALAWLGALQLVLLVVRHLRGRVISGSSSWAIPAYLACLTAESSLWVVHAILMWRIKSLVPEVATLMDLFSVTIFGVIGGHADWRALCAIVCPPLLALCWILISSLISIQAPTIAVLLGSVAIVVTCSGLMYYGVILYQRDDALARTTTALARATAETVASQKFLEMVSDIAEVGGWMYVPHERRFIWSGITRKIHDVDENVQISASSDFQFVREDYRPALAESFEAALAHDAPIKLELPVRTAKGREIWVRVIGRRIDEQGARPCLFGALQDITEQVGIETRLKELADQAKQASLAKDQFLANMSHEIRTPLNGIVGIAAAMARTDLDPRQQEMISLINMSGETLERLLSDLLDLSKIEAGHIDLDQEPFDLKQSVEAAAKVMKAAADEKALDFVVSFARSAEGLFVGDAVRIRQIVTNLISNAVKFTTSGSVTLEVAAEAPPDPSASTSVSIRVTDTGIGFDGSTADKLFRRFEQADGSITRRFGGTGLGLSISQALANAMGGMISASGQPGVGSAFELVLPLRRVGKDEPAPAPAAPLPPGPMADAALKVLLAEDHPVNRRTIQLILEPFGFEILEATDGVEAVDLYQRQAFDLILMDMQMPNMDGLEATRAIRAIEARTGRVRTPIVMVSANAMTAHAEQALAAGCDVHVPKPITPASLMDGLSRAFDVAEPA